MFENFVLIVAKRRALGKRGRACRRKSCGKSYRSMTYFRLLPLSLRQKEKTAYLLINMMLKLKSMTCTELGHATNNQHVTNNDKLNNFHLSEIVKN